VDPSRTGHKGESLDVIVWCLGFGAAWPVVLLWALLSLFVFVLAAGGIVVLIAFGVDEGRPAMWIAGVPPVERAMKGTGKWLDGPATVGVWPIFRPCG
jgi:hypothetical protein